MSPADFEKGLVGLATTYAKAIHDHQRPAGWGSMAVGKFASVSCSQCGGEFGAGDSGFSSCTSHLIACRLSGQIDDSQWEQHCGDTEGLREEFVAYVARRSSEVRYEHGLVVAQLAGRA